MKIISSSDKRMVGEKTKYGPKTAIENRTVSYWALVRTYLDHHYGLPRPEGEPKKFCVFTANSMGDNNDFLHEAMVSEFTSMEAMEEFCEEHRKDYSSDFDHPLIIKSVNGMIIDTTV